MKCPNGHDVVPARHGPEPISASSPEDWFYCRECSYCDGEGGVLGYGMFLAPSEVQEIGQAQTNEVHS
jgi:hypothetical protein